MQTPKQYFQHHPEVDKFHFTSDGQAFFNEEDAHSFASGLKDKKVKTLTREQADAETESEEDVTVDTSDKIEEIKAPIVPADAKKEGIKEPVITAGKDAGKEAAKDAAKK